MHRAALLSPQARKAARSHTSPRAAASVAAPAAAATVADEEKETLGGGCVAQHRTASLPSGATVHFVDAGPRGKADNVFVLLHGFPDTWLSWRKQIPALAAAGFRVLAVDLRGYGRSVPPSVAVEAFGAAHVVGDLQELLDVVKVKTCTAVGHDWGAAVAWRLAAAEPSRVTRLAILNVPHPKTFRDTLRTNLVQLRRSWYIYAFRIPRLAEAALAANDHAALRKLYQGEDAATVDRYVDAFKTRGYTGPINYYRATFRRDSGWAAPMPVLSLPTLVLWGEKDLYLIKEMADPPRELVLNSRVVRLPLAGHWVHWDDADTCSDELLRLAKTAV